MKKEVKILAANVLAEKIIQRKCRAAVSEMAELAAVPVVIIQKAVMVLLQRWWIGSSPLQSTRI